MGLYVCEGVGGVGLATVFLFIFASFLAVGCHASVIGSHREMCSVSVTVCLSISLFVYFLFFVVCGNVCVCVPTAQ